MDEDYPTASRFRVLAEKGTTCTSPPGYPPVNCLYRNFFRLLFFLLTIIVMFTYLSLSSNLQAAEKKPPGQGKTGNGENVKLKYEKLNLDKEMRKEMETILPVGFRLNGGKILEDGRYIVLLSGPPKENRKLIADAVNFLDRLFDSSCQTLISPETAGTFPDLDEKSGIIQIYFRCNFGSKRINTASKKMNVKEKFALFNDTLREIYLIKPPKIEFQRIEFIKNPDEIFIDFSGSYNDMPGETIRRAVGFLNNAEQSRYLVKPGIASKNSDSITNRMYFQVPDYFEPYNKSRRKQFLNFILKTAPPNFNLKKVYFNNASKGFIIEISPQSKDKAAILKSIVTFLKEFSRLKGTEQLFFDRLVIHLSKDKTGIERMFIEMRQLDDFLKIGKERPVTPGIEKIKDYYRESGIKELETLINKYPQEIFSDGYMHRGNDGKMLILTICGE